MLHACCSVVVACLAACPDTPAGEGEGERPGDRNGGEGEGDAGEGEGDVGEGEGEGDAGEGEGEGEGDVPLVASAGAHVVFLNASSDVYTKGNPDDSTRNVSGVFFSQVTNGEQVTVEGFRGNQNRFRNVLTCVQALYAPFDIEITDVDPGDAPHLEIFFGASSTVTTASGPPLFSRSQCEAVADGTGFVDDRFNTDSQVVCEETAAVVGQLLGLTVVDDCRDVMGFVVPACGTKAFLDEPLACGPTATQHFPCVCGGADEDTRAHLLELLGPHP